MLITNYESSVDTSWYSTQRCNCRAQHRATLHHLAAAAAALVPTTVPPTPVLFQPIVINMASAILRTFTILGAFSSAWCHTGHMHEDHSPVCFSSDCKVQLSPDLALTYRIHLPANDHNFDKDHDVQCKECKISVQVRYEGMAWLGFGISENGKMIGSHAVIGQPGISSPRTYLLGGKDKGSLELTESNLEADSIAFLGGETILTFTLTFGDWGAPIANGPGIRLNGQTTFIWAHGNDGETALNYHGPNNKNTHTIGNLLTFSEEAEQGLMTLQAQELKTRSAWLAHGIMGFLAWGVFAPLAVTTAIMRDCPVPTVLKGIARRISEKWLYIHVGLNTFAYTVTLVLFSVAVSSINKEDHEHWEHPHSKMGLAMFILSSFQVLGGYCRPSNATTSPNEGASEQGENGEEGSPNETEGNGVKAMPTKSTLRQTWELMHNTIGVMLFLFGVWQMYGGIELYHLRYDNSNAGVLLGLYVAYAAVWTGIIIAGIVYKWFGQGRGLGNSNDTKDLESLHLEMSDQGDSHDAPVDAAPVENESHEFT